MKFKSRYTKQTITRVLTITRVFSKGDMDDFDLWREKDRSIQFWIDKHCEAIHLADNCYRENRELKAKIENLKKRLRRSVSELEAGYDDE